jgi:hypothetical protein
MTDDFIEMDTAALQRQFAEISKKLSGIERDLRNDIMDTVLREAAEQLQAEQKRILSVAPSEGVRSLAADLSIWKDNRKPANAKVSYRAGYSDDKISKSIKYFVIEYGRPGRRGKSKDSLGRMIGRLQPYSHIRAAWFLKREAINKYIGERVNAEILERWNRNG